MEPRYKHKFNKGDRVRHGLPEADHRSRMDVYAHQKVYLVIDKAWGPISQEWRYTLMDTKDTLEKRLKNGNLKDMRKLLHDATAA